jgi:hypothetical protein
MLQKPHRQTPAAITILSRSASVAQRIEQTLQRALALGGGSEGPPLLTAAMHHAVFPGGARIRPQLCLAVASACGDPRPGAGRGRRRRPRTAALRIAGARRPALLRRRPHAAGPALGACRLRRAHRRAGRRRADRVGLPGAGRSCRRVRNPAWLPLSGCWRPAWAGRMASWPGRPGSASRGFRCAPTSAPRPARCSPPHRGRCAGRRADPAPWRAFGVPGRGLPGGRRHPRRGGRPAGWASPPDATVRSPAQLGHRTGPVRRHRAISTAWSSARSRPFPTADGAPRCAPWCAPSPNAWCRRTACATCARGLARSPAPQAARSTRQPGMAQPEPPLAG